MASQFGFKNLNPDGTPNNTLTKSNVKFKDIKTGNEISYTSLTRVSLTGHYYADGFSNIYKANIYIDDVLQQSYGTVDVGYTAPTFENTTLSGTTVFGGNQDLVGHNITYANDVQTKTLSEALYVFKTFWTLIG